MSTPPTPLPSRDVRFRRLLAPGATFLAFSGLWLIWALRYAQTGWDFTEFYIAGHLPVSSLYSHAAYMEFGRRDLAPIGIQYYPPFVRPAVFALALKPLALFSYWKAYWLWATVCFAAYIAALVALFRRLNLPFTYLAWFAIFYPGMASIVTGQDSDVYLLVLVGALLCLIAGRDVAGGLLLSLCVYKFNLVPFLPFVLLFKRRWKSLAAFSAGSSVAAIVSAILAPPSQYLAILRSIPEISVGSIPSGLRGVFIRSGHPDWYYPMAVIAAVLCLYLVYKLPLVESFAVAVIAPTLMAYHVGSYDCATLVVPICVAWASASQKMRAALLTLLVLPIAWMLGSDYFQVIAELVLLGHFFYISRIVSRDSQSTFVMTAR